MLELPLSPNERACILDLANAGGKVMLVGGLVRAKLLGKPLQGDVDVEVHNLPLKEVSRIAEKHGGKLCGKAFGIHVVGNMEIALPRRERKTGRGHTNFEVEIDPFLGLWEATARRDFTINAVTIDVMSGEIYDPHGGKIDLAAGILRHTSSRFVEDPLRVLRAMQFSARLGFAVHPGTIELCKTLDLTELSPERFWKEWKKLLLKGKKISFGLEFLQKSNAIRFFPELYEINLREIGEALNKAAGQELEVMLGILCSQMSDCTKFLKRMTSEKKILKVVPSLVHHVNDIPKAATKPSALRRLSLKVNLRQLAAVGQALGIPGSDWLAQNAIEPVKPIVTGKDLLAIGWKPGPKLGRALKELFDAQLDGKIKTRREALEWARRWQHEHI